MRTILTQPNAGSEETAANHETEPAVMEWALFQLGGQIRDELRT